MPTHPSQVFPAAASRARRLLSACLLLAASACAPSAPPGEDVPGVLRGALEEENGITTNGLSANGITTNGLLSTGLTSLSLALPTFSSWFNADRTNRGLAMRYIARCGLASGQSLAWTNPVTGVAYSWGGTLGLTPGWASGLPATQLELQLMSACLAAHVNAYGESVQISVLGRDATGAPIPVGESELSTYSVREGCFFGDLTTQDGVISGSDRASPASESSARACALSNQAPGAPGLCASIVYQGSCASLGCTLDTTGTWYESCSYGGKTFRPLTTRVQPQVVYTCGDGVCQVSEHCGAGTTADACLADCGPCY